MDYRSAEREGKNIPNELYWGRLFAGIDEHFDEAQSQALLERVMATLAQRQRRRSWISRTVRRLFGLLRRRPKAELPTNVFAFRSSVSAGGNAPTRTLIS